MAVLVGVLGVLFLSLFFPSGIVRIHTYILSVPFIGSINKVIWLVVKFIWLLPAVFIAILTGKGCRDVIYKYLAKRRIKFRATHYRWETVRRMMRDRKIKDWSGSIGSFIIGMLFLVSSINFYFSRMPFVFFFLSFAVINIVITVLDLCIIYFCRKNIARNVIEINERSERSFLPDYQIRPTNSSEEWAFIVYLAKQKGFNDPDDKVILAIILINEYLKANSSIVYGFRDGSLIWPFIILALLGNEGIKLKIKQFAETMNLDILYEMAEQGLDDALWTLVSCHEIDKKLFGENHLYLYLKDLAVRRQSQTARQVLWHLFGRWDDLTQEQAEIIAQALGIDIKELLFKGPVRFIHDFPLTFFGKNWAIIQHALELLIKSNPGKQTFNVVLVGAGQRIFDNRVQPITAPFEVAAVFTRANKGVKVTVWDISERYLKYAQLQGKTSFSLVYPDEFSTREFPSQKKAEEYIESIATAFGSVFKKELKKKEKNCQSQVEKYIEEIIAAFGSRFKKKFKIKNKIKKKNPRTPPQIIYTIDLPQEVIDGISYVKRNICYPQQWGSDKVDAFIVLNTLESIAPFPPIREEIVGAMAKRLNEAGIILLSDFVKIIYPPEENSNSFGYKEYMGLKESWVNSFPPLCNKLGLNDLTSRLPKKTVVHHPSSQKFFLAQKPRKKLSPSSSSVARNEVFSAASKISAEDLWQICQDKVRRETEDFKRGFVAHDSSEIPIAINARLYGSFEEIIKDLRMLYEMGIRRVYLLGMYEESQVSHKMNQDKRDDKDYNFFYDRDKQNRVISVVKSEASFRNENLHASAFSIPDHAKPNPKLGGYKSLKVLLEKAEQLGMEIIADLVAHSTSIDCIWLRDEFLQEGPYYW
ncbi:MAG: hypothetical protein JSV34_06760, partial [Candidatus Omnitrophota bacterium]